MQNSGKYITPQYDDVEKPMKQTISRWKPREDLT